MKARVMHPDRRSTATRVALDADSALIRPDTTGDGVRVVLVLDDGQFTDLLAVLVLEHRRRDGGA